MHDPCVVPLKRIPCIKGSFRFYLLLQINFTLGTGLAFQLSSLEKMHVCLITKKMAASSSHSLTALNFASEPMPLWIINKPETIFPSNLEFCNIAEMRICILWKMHCYSFKDDKFIFSRNITLGSLKFIFTERIIWPICQRP